MTDEQFSHIDTSLFLLKSMRENHDKMMKLAEVHEARENMHTQRLDQIAQTYRAFL